LATGFLEGALGASLAGEALAFLAAGFLEEGAGFAGFFGAGLACFFAAGLAGFLAAGLFLVTGVFALAGADFFAAGLAFAGLVGFFAMKVRLIKRGGICS
jgi:hypothetical protein